MFPFRDKCSPANLFDKTLGVKNKSQQKRLAGKLHSNKPCFNAQIGLCPGVCAGTVSARDYARTIQHIKLFFEGRKSTLIASLKRDMKRAAKELRFEEASRIKKTLFALSHIQDIALLKQVLPRSSASVPHNSASFRIEAYDTAHISGTNTVGVMVVLENNEPKKSDYRKFKIRTSTNDDIASLREILSRRFTHTEWPMPNLLVIDGGKGQVNAAEKALAEWGIVIPVVGVVKDERHRPREIIGNMSARKNYERAILLANSEAHRFAIAYHRNMRRKIK
ncbi:MAG: Excinuclease ABC, C subunit domain protein [Parcubacteria group bacterium GW2011_GWA1_47_8]|nr:MAG: Excinuclease ABC, C subunit domain protein [Parcubacteria group bacterium GW2011_GWA1_47_8]